MPPTRGSGGQPSMGWPCWFGLLLCGRREGLKELDKNIDDLHGRDASVAFQRHTFSRELVDDRQPLERSPIRGSIVDEVPRPDVVPALRPVARAAVGTASQSSLLPLSSRHFQTFPPPQPVDSLAVHTPALHAKQRPDPTVSVPRILQHQLQDALDQRLLIVSRLRYVPLRRTRLSDSPAHATLRDVQYPSDVLDAPTPACRAQNFPSRTPLLNSLRI